MRLSFSGVAEVAEQWKTAKRTLGIKSNKWHEEKPGDWVDAHHPGLAWTDDKREEERSLERGNLITSVLHVSLAFHS